MKRDFCLVKVFGQLAVTDRGTGIYWCPFDNRTFQLWNGERISGRSFGAFGDDASCAVRNESNFVAAAERWMTEGRK